MTDLLEHNQKTLDELNQFINNGHNCCVVNPCGSGKTSIMARFIEDHKDSTFIIFTKQLNAKNYYLNSNKSFNNITIVTYAKMWSDYKRNNIDKYKADFYILDEAHYIGASNWNKAFYSLVDKYNPLIIGFTATAQRFEDQGTSASIVTRYFDNNSAGNYSTKDLENIGLFVEPEYVLSLYNLGTIIDKKTTDILDSDLEDVDKNKLIEKLNKIYEKWNKESKPSIVLREKLPNYMYKDKCNRILVYVPSVNDLNQHKFYINTIIKSIFSNKVIKSYEYTYRTSEKALNDFLTDDNTTDIKILYSIDKIMETIHIDDLRIIIMLRPSVSNRIIIQQFGRLNTISNKNKPIIIDMVNNLNNIKSILYDTRDINKSNTYTKKSISLPYIKYYFDVFNSIDKALNKFTYYTYNGFIGTLKDICFVFNADYKEAKKLLLAGYEIDYIMDTVKHTNIRIKQSIIDGNELYNEEDFIKLNEEQQQFAKDNMYIVDSFIEHRQLTDDDIKQNLYCKFLQLIPHININGSWTRQYIINTLRRFYLIIYKNRLIYESYHNENISELDIDADENNCIDKINEYEYVKDKLIFLMLGMLTRKEIATIILRYNIDFSPALEINHYNKRNIRHFIHRLIAISMNSCHITLKKNIYEKYTRMTLYKSDFVALVKSTTKTFFDTYNFNNYKDIDTFLNDFIVYIKSLELNNEITTMFITIINVTRDDLLYISNIDNHKECTLEEVSKVFGVTRERIRQIEHRAFKKIRQYNLQIKD